ncbi:Hypothetical predicted protein, partial [Prunus dulcis]
MTSSRVAWVSFRALERRVLKGRCDVIASQLWNEGFRKEGMTSSRVTGVSLQASKLRVLNGRYDVIASRVSFQASEQGVLKGRYDAIASCHMLEESKEDRRQFLAKLWCGGGNCRASCVVEITRVLPDNASIFTPIKKSLDINFDTDDFPPPIPPGREWTFTSSFSTDPTTSHDAEAG